MMNTPNDSLKMTALAVTVQFYFSAVKNAMSKRMFDRAGPIFKEIT